MTASRSLEYHITVDRVSHWCRWYTRGLSPEIRDSRRDEIASDLYEQAHFADETGMTARALTRSIRRRAIRGALADLSWRREQRARGRLSAAAASAPLNGGLPVTTAVLSMMLLTVGVFVSARIGMSMARQEWGYDLDLAVTVWLSTIGTVCALMLLARTRTRWLGALWMMIAVYGLVRYGGKALYYSSATYSQLQLTVPNWNLMNLGLVAGLACFYFAMAVWWWPARPARAGAGAVSARRAPGPEIHA